MSNFTRSYETFLADSSKRVVEIKLKLVVNDSTGTVGFTDIMLQRGKISSEWSAHPSEIQWSKNE